MMKSIEGAIVVVLFMAGLTGEGESADPLAVETFLTVRTLAQMGVNSDDVACQTSRTSMLQQ